MPTSIDGNRPHLLVISYLFLPDTCGGAAIFADLCHALVERGFDVTVRCAYSHYPEWKDKSGHNGLRIDRSKDLGLKVERFGLYIPQNPKSIGQRLLYETSYFLSLCRSLIAGSRFDVVMVYCPLAGSVAFAALHKFLRRTPLFLNVQDLPADAAAAGGLARSAVFRNFLGGVQRFLFNAADVWSSISPVMISRLETLRRRDQPVMFLPNWLHNSITEEIGRLPSKVGRSLSVPVRLFYSGNIGGKQGLLEFCQSLGAGTVPFEFRIHGDGGAAAELRDWIASSGDDRFSFGPLIDEAGFVHALHEADLFVITEKSGSGASFFPSKAIPAMALGTPILAVSDPESPLGSEMRAHGLGPWFSWDRCDDVSDMLGSLPGREAELATWQQNSLDRSRFYNREYCVNLIETTLRGLVRGQVFEDLHSPIATAVSNSSDEGSSPVPVQVATSWVGRPSIRDES